MKGLLLRGWSREQRHWGTLLQHLRAQVPGVDFYCLDLPGSGTECQRSSPFTIPGIVSDLRPRWHALCGENHGPALVIGISMGGMVALEWARRYPEEFSEVVLINSSLGGISWPWERLRFTRLGALAKIAMIRDPMDREFQILRLTTGLSVERCREISGDWASISSSAPVSFRSTLAQIVAASTFRLMAPVSARCVVLTSAGDRLVSHSCSERLAMKLGAELRQHPTAGHDLPLEDPTWVARQISEFHKSAVTGP